MRACSRPAAPVSVAAGLALMSAMLTAPITAQERPNFLPTPPTASTPKHPWLIKDLGEVPEIHFQKVEPLREPVLSKALNTLTPEEQDRLQKVRAEMTARITQTLDKINKANQTGTDHFMKVMVELRPDLAGLPWVMGDACRTSKERSTALVREVSVVRAALRFPKDEPLPPPSMATRIDKLPWERYDTLTETMNTKLVTPLNKEELPFARVAALMQILGPAAPNVREQMVKRVAKIQQKDATTALARLAVFSTEAEVRKAAIAALKERKKQDYTPILTQALRYPWAPAARNASEAMVALACIDQVPGLVAFLDEPDPRAPVTHGRKATVREVVKVNHHHNCLLCHAPVKPNDSVTASDVVLAQIPSPAQPLPSQSLGYKSKKLPIELAIRVDVTYLRQDFSMLQPVADSEPWPAMQRFDYLVREREVGANDVRAYQNWFTEQGAGYVSPQHRAALHALRELTGRDAAPNAQAWRKVLKL